jgi:hypothetical protein
MQKLYASKLAEDRDKMTDHMTTPINLRRHGLGRHEAIAYKLKCAFSSKIKKDQKLKC